jgi:hypothetical protein
MSNLKKIEPEKIVTLLRGEVGEVIQSWVVFKIYSAKAAELRSVNLHEDKENQQLTLINLVRSKFRDDLILRLAELSSRRYDTINFHFAADKFKIQQNEVKAFREYLKVHHIEFRRNNNIAHKHISPTWKELDPMPHVPYLVITKAIAWAISLMKKFDKEYFGDGYKLIWQEERKCRYELEGPASAKYLLLPYKARVR